MDVLKLVYDVGMRIMLASIVTTAVLTCITVVGHLIKAPWYDAAMFAVNISGAVGIVSGAATIAILTVGKWLRDKRSRSRKSGGHDG